MDFVNFEQAQKRLGKTPEELNEMIKKGELRGFRDGPAWKFRKEDIDSRAGGPAEEGEKEAGDTLMSIDADILFAEEEEVPADSAAETWIAADTEGVFPSGGGERGVSDAMSAPEAEPAPLALSPETDESSLGAVLSDEELGGGAGVDAAEGPVIAVDTESGMAMVSAPSGAASVPSRTRIVTLVEPPAHHAHFTFMLALAAIALGIAGMGVLAVIQGSMPSFLVAIGSESTPLILLVAGAVIVGLAAMVGYVLDRQRAAREAMSG